jgi:hypothetical protein
MKTISLSPIKATVIILLFGASSCSNNSSQGNTTSVADSISTASRRSDSAINKRNLSHNSTSANTADSVANNGGNNNQSNIDNKQSWSLTITQSTTKSYLDSIAAVWKNENIDLNISTLKYDGSNLVKIKGSVTINTKAGSHASGEFKSENPVSIRIKVDDSPNVIIKNN